MRSLYLKYLFLIIRYPVQSIQNFNSYGLLFEVLLILAKSLEEGGRFWRSGIHSRMPCLFRRPYVNRMYSAHAFSLEHVHDSGYAVLQVTTDLLHLEHN